jgi:hypothetical protein
MLARRNVIRLGLKLFAGRACVYTKMNCDCCLLIPLLQTVGFRFFLSKINLHLLNSCLAPGSKEE